MAINENRKYMNFRAWTSSSRHIERIIIKCKSKIDDYESEFEFRFNESETDKYISLIQDYIVGHNEGLYRQSKKNKYICTIRENDEEMIAVIIRLK